MRFLDAQSGWAVGDNGTLLATGDGGISWQQRDSGGSDQLAKVTFADARHGWAVGDNGTILTIAVPDSTAVAQAVDFSTIRAALKSIGLSEPQIGQPLVDFKSREDDIYERKKRIAQDQQTVDAYAPKADNAHVGADLFYNPMFLSNLNRLGITIYAFFAVTIVVAIYRYSQRLAAHYDACADALELGDGVIDQHFRQLIGVLSPGSIDFGKIPRSPVDHAAEALQNALRDARRKQ